tara:strand:- start:211 stop:939 length:729 start_codon:yes stop_codon:yes gene_type:complete
MVPYLYCKNNSQIFIKLNINMMNIKKYKLILMFHDITNYPKSNYDINWSKFKRIIFSFNILFKFINKKIEQKILFTFDDGYHSSMKAARYLSRYFGIKSVIFISTNNINAYGYLKKSSIKFNTKNVLIGSHGVSHISLNNKLTDLEIHKELKDSKSILSELTKKEISFLSFPNGDYSKKALKISSDLNFKYVFTSKRASNRIMQKDSTINRFVILKNTPILLLFLAYTGMLDRVQALKRKWV